MLEIGKFANRFFKKVYSLYKTLKTIVSDKGMQFIFIFQIILSKRLKIVLKPLTAFNL